MSWATRRILWPSLGVAFLLVVTLLRTSMAERTPIPLEAGATVAVIAVATLAAFVTARITGDLSMVFVATGAAGVAANLLLFDLIWQEGLGGLRGLTLPEADLSAPAFANLIAWLSFAICMLFAVPWWDRRGRRPLVGWSIVLAGLGSVAIVDLAVFLTRTDTVIARIEGPRGAITDVSVIGPVAAILAWVVIGVLAVAAARCMLDARRGAASGWLCAATVSAIGAPAAWLLGRSHDLEAFRAATTWYIGVPSAVGVFVLLAALSSTRSEVSAMRRASDRADAILEGRAEIAGMIAHEVRGPVTTIRGIASTAAAHYEGLDDGERREFFSLIEQESRRLLGAVDQTSLALKIDAGSLSFQMMPAPLATIVRAGIEAASVPSSEHGVRVVAQEEVTLVADATRLTEVVRQLVDNAAKYSPPGTPITVRAVAEDGAAVIEVVDEGPGIPVDQRAVVFERFNRWRPRGYEERPGNGLGLFICRGLVAEHQGEIAVEDGPSGGTMLRVRLPLEGTEDGQFRPEGHAPDLR
jgi:signal transduction histidine kinase